MSLTYAVLDAEGNCINKVLWDGQSNWHPPEGCTAVPDPDNQYNIKLEEPPQLTVEEKLRFAGLTVDELKEALGLS